MENLKDFKDFINEEKDVSHGMLHVTGQILELKIVKSQNNDLTKLTIDGISTLPNIKSLETLKSEYQEKDWDILEERYNNILSSNGYDIDNLVKEFESRLNNIVLNIQAEINDIN